MSRIQTVDATLREIADGIFAWEQPDGGWGLSNSGLVTHAGASLLVDTLFDKRSTERMLAEMRRKVAAARDVGCVVNTHANGDHCWGNELVEGARIVASSACAAEMAELPPAKMAALMALCRGVAGLGALGRGMGRTFSKIGLSKAGSLFEAAWYLVEAFGSFDFRGTRLVLPSETFDGELSLDVKGRRVELFEVGPAHTQGDTIAWIPDARVVFTGDVIFNQTHPLVWAGPVGSWLRACERILALDPAVVVPGHGPITDARCVREMVDYFARLTQEARRGYDAGAGAQETARQIAPDFANGRAGVERLAVNVAALYREFSGSPGEAEVFTAFGDMARLAASLRRGAQA
jgi:glyoxylase-like metal-dependent hydrolase (beta-lactamase superfamily II)